MCVCSKPNLFLMSSDSQVQFLLAYDASGSTANCAFYHEQTQRIVAELPHDSTRILMWDNNHKVISHKKLCDINNNKQGFGSTCSDQIAQYIHSIDFHGHLVIVSDGEVDSRSIDKCGLILGNEWKFESVIAHLIGYNNVNLSITCPFTRASPHVVYLYKSLNAYEKERSCSMTAEELSAVNLVQTVNSIGQFMQHAETIERAVVVRTMGTMGDPKLRDEILAMKKRMISALAREKGSSDSVTDLYAALDAGQTQTAIQLAKTLTDEYYDIGSDSETDTKTWSARINRLVSLCEGALRSTFDLSNLNAAISSDHMRRAAQVGAAPNAQSLPVSEVSELDANGFVCPITLDGALELMLLLVDNHGGQDEQDQEASQPVLAGLDKDVINDLIDCPLNLFRYPDVVQRLAAKLDHPISLLAYRDADRSGMPFTRSPLSRRLIAGGICLGSSEAHCKATTWALSHALAGGKLAGSIDLWFACVWLLIEQGSVPRLAELLPQFRQHMQYRLRSHSTFMSLTGRPEFPSTRVKLGVATWYVFASCVFGLPPHQDVMRFHLPHIAQMKQLLSLTGYSVPVEVDAHIGKLRVVLSMLGWVKKDRHRLPNLMLALKQRCLRVNIAEINATVSETEHVQEFIPVDGTPTQEQIQVVYSLLPAHFRMFDAKMLFGLAALVDPSKSGADVSLSIEWQPAEIAAAVVEWDHGVGDIPLAPIRICTATCRPFFRPSAASQDTWNQLSERFYGLVPPKLVSHDFHFGNFVLKYKFYPSRDEFLTYLHNRVVVHGVTNHSTLPAQQDVFLTRVFARHSTVLSEISDPAEFIRRFNASRGLEVRAEMEAAERDA